MNVSELTWNQCTSYGRFTKKYTQIKQPLVYEYSYVYLCTCVQNCIHSKAQIKAIQNRPYQTFIFSIYFLMVHFHLKFPCQLHGGRKDYLDENRTPGLSRLQFNNKTCQICLKVGDMIPSLKQFL